MFTKTIITRLATCLLAAFLISSCNKSELSEPESGYHRVRIYDDSLAEPRNESIRIAAGNSRLLMTYGNTPDHIDFLLNGLVFPSPAKNVCMLTDNEGNLIRRDTLPAGLNVSSIIPLPDNSFLILSYTGIVNLVGGEKWVFLTRVNPDGVVGSTSTLNFPGITGLPFTSFNGQLKLTPNGNVLISFGYDDANFHNGNFVGEMDTQGNFLWHKLDLPYFFLDYVSLPDGGYMTLLSIQDQITFEITNYITKTNSTLDTAWSRIIPLQGWLEGLKFVSKGDGNYRLGHMIRQGGKAYYKLFDMDATGEIVDSNSYPIIVNIDMSYYPSTVMLQKGTSGTFISHSNRTVFGSVLGQFNTMFVNIDKDLNITESSVSQGHSNDMLSAACVTSDGTIASFGLIQCYNTSYYKPMLVLIN